MAHDPDPPRLTPLEADELTAEQLELLGPTGGAGSMNIFRTLVRHRGLYRRWAPFGGKLLRGGKLSPRDRELVILRAALRCGAAYEWGQHVAIARDAGLADDEIRAVAADPDGGGSPHPWSGQDAELLSAVDQLVTDHVIDRPTWEGLLQRYTDEQLIDLTLLAGHYAMLAGALNSFGVPLDGDEPALGQVERSHR